MKMRAFIPVLAVLALAFPVLGGTIVSIDPTNQTIYNGETITATVDVQDVTDLYGFEFNIVYDPTLLSATNVTEGAFLPAGGATDFFSGDTSTPGQINFVFDILESAVSGVSGSGPLATLQFLVVNGYGQSPITIDPSSFLVDSSLNNIDATFNGAQVQTPEPATYGLLGSGLIGLAWFLRKKVRR
jgi:hypothetical protein